MLAANPNPETETGACLAPHLIELGDEG